MLINHEDSVLCVDFGDLCHSYNSIFCTGSFWQAVSGVWRTAQQLYPTLCTSSPRKEQEQAVERKEQGPVERKCISYSLYQQSEDPPSPVYTDGFLLNVEIAHVLFPTWKIHL